MSGARDGGMGHDAIDDGHESDPRHGGVLHDVRAHRGQ